jgi:hypothetical protein
MITLKPLALPRPNPDDWSELVPPSVVAHAPPARAPKTTHVSVHVYPKAAEIEASLELLEAFPADRWSSRRRITSKAESTAYANSSSPLAPIVSRRAGWFFSGARRWHGRVREPGVRADG